MAWRECDEKFWDEDLNDEGNAFAMHYYNGTEKEGSPYLEDYERTFADLPSVYHLEDTWQNYDKIAAVITHRFEEWRRREPGC